MQPLYARTLPDDERGLVAALWRGIQYNGADDDNIHGLFAIDDDFQGVWVDNTTDASTGNGWFIQDAAAGGTVESFAVSAGNPDGIVVLSATTGTDHFGIEAHYGTTSTSRGVVTLPTATTNPRGTVVFQTRVNLTNQKQFVLGLTEPIVEFLGATSALPETSDYFVFSRLDGGGLNLSVANDNAGGTAVTDSYELLTTAEMDALEDATSNWFVLGARINKDNSVEVSVNGEYFSSGKMGINPLALPIEALTFKYGVYRGATDDQATVSLPIDSLKVFVEGLQPTS